MNRRIALIASIVCVVASPAQAESCTRSRDFLLEGSLELPQKPSVYRDLYRGCIETLRLSNVEDAFVLKVGAIAVIPRRDDMMATASTLAQFCERFPRVTLHFIGRKDRTRATNIAQAVQMTSARPTPCEKIKGGG